jgi:hypothetical protein
MVAGRLCAQRFLESGPSAIHTGFERAEIALVIVCPFWSGAARASGGAASISGANNDVKSLEGAGYVRRVATPAEDAGGRASVSVVEAGHRQRVALKK